VGQSWKIDRNQNFGRTSAISTIRGAKSLEGESRRRRFTMSGQNSDENRAKFLEALEKKRKGNSHKGDAKSRDSKVRGGQSSGSTQKMFRRKSGSS